MLTQILVATAFIGGLLLWARWAYGLGTEQPPQPPRPAPRITNHSSEAIKALNAGGYPAYLRSEHWRQTSNTTKKLAGYACEICGSPGPLDGHHYHEGYRRLGFEQPGKHTAALCRPCHKRWAPLTPQNTADIRRNLHPSDAPLIVQGISIVPAALAVATSAVVSVAAIAIITSPLWLTAWFVIYGATH